MAKNQGRKTQTEAWASIQNGDLYFEDVRQCAMHDDAFAEMMNDKHLKKVRVVSLSVNWVEKDWIDFSTSITAKVNTEFTMRQEERGGSIHWYAYRRVQGVLHKRYVGQSDRITEERLLAIARALPTG